MNGFQNEESFSSEKIGPFCPTLNSPLKMNSSKAFFSPGFDNCRIDWFRASSQKKLNEILQFIFSSVMEINFIAQNEFFFFH